MTNPAISYAFVTGYMETESLILQHDTTDSGVTITINGTTFSNVSVGNRTAYRCAASGQQRAVCAISIELLDARFVYEDGESLFRASPARFDADRITRAFRSRG